MPAGDLYEGPVCYANGVHYPVKFDRNGEEVGPDWKRPLIWVDDKAGSATLNKLAHFRFASKTDPSHEHLYHKRTIEVNVE